MLIFMDVQLLLDYLFETTTSSYRHDCIIKNIYIIFIIFVVTFLCELKSSKVYI